MVYEDMQMYERALATGARACAAASQPQAQGGDASARARSAADGVEWPGRGRRWRGGERGALQSCSR